MDGMFDGLGTEIIVLLLAGAGIGAGTILVYKNTSKKNRFKQKAGKNSVQIQSGRDVNIER